jgi:hypothetical protein
MDLQKMIIISLRNIFFAIAVIVLALPVLLALPGISGFFYQALSIIGLKGE